MLDVLQWSRHHRLFPGQGALDVSGLLAQVVAAGYTGPLSLEVFNDVFRQADPRPTAPAITAALRALGFVPTGRHRTRSVRRWQQGEIDILVDEGPARPGTFDVAALAIESDDPSDHARRAEALLAPRPHRGGSEGDPPAVTAPNGTGLFFCGTEPADWRAAFQPTGAEPAAGTGTGLGRIDHVVLAQPFDRFAESLLFYRSVIGLEPLDEVEYAAPFGLVHSRTLTDPNGSVRLALHRAVLRRGPWAPAVPDPEHIAFTTDDIFSTARALRDRGAPVLPITDNYYDDLDARFALAPERLAEMRELNVLYDRDGDGELFHLYTPILGSRVFFEVLQRVNGHNGYGARNAPVRMAAHRQAAQTSQKK